MSMRNGRVTLLCKLRLNLSFEEVDFFLIKGRSAKEKTNYTIILFRMVDSDESANNISDDNYRSKQNID